MFEEKITGFTFVTAFRYFPIIFQTRITGNREITVFRTSPAVFCFSVINYRKSAISALYFILHSAFHTDTYVAFFNFSSLKFLRREMYVVAPLWYSYSYQIVIYTTVAPLSSDALCHIKQRYAPL